MQIKPVTVAALLVIVLAGGAEALRFAPAFQPLFPLLPWAPPEENADGYVVSCLTPGLKKEDLHAEVVGTDAFPVLVVRGESKEEHGTPPDAKDKKDAKDATNAKEKASFFRTKYQKFEQRMSLPSDVDQDKMAAKYEDGILAITLPRKAGTLPQKPPNNIDIK
ncbi:hypothetical protein T484DRAFT_1832823 [Baffinella frigidus]|nr:hypothetical protein T484DRAFT_1832823 [Cryptophyta sp. CCMP2293]